MVYLTGDIHGDPERVVQFCLSMKPRRTDTIILLGDVAANYMSVILTSTIFAASLY